VQKDKLILTAATAYFAVLALIAKSEAMQDICWGALIGMGLLLIWYKK